MLALWPFVSINVSHEPNKLGSECQVQESQSKALHTFSSTMICHVVLKSFDAWAILPPVGKAQAAALRPSDLSFWACAACVSSVLDSDLISASNVRSPMSNRLVQHIQWHLEWNYQLIEEWVEWLAGKELPRITSSKGPLGELARNSLCRPYWPTPYLPDPLQTLVAVTLRNLAVQARYQRTVAPTPDGGTFGLDWFRCEEACQRLPDSAPVLLVLHSITGNSNLGFVKSLCAAGYKQGWRPVAMLYRGCGGLSLESPRVYSANDTGDLQVAVAGLRTMYPDAPILLAGFSLGALLVTKFLAEAASSTAASGVVAAAAASSPFDLGAAWKRMAAAFPISITFISQYAIVLRWIHYAWRHWNQIKHLPGVSWHRIAASYTMMHIDHELTCKANSIENTDAYYEQASSFQYIPKIKTPCLFQLAADDPFVKQLPETESQQNDHTVILATKKGGHCAHLQGVIPFRPSYLDDSIVCFFTAVLRQKHVLKEE